MDVRKVEVRIDRRDVRVRLGDAKGETDHVLEGDAFKRVALAAKPLFDELSQRVGPVVGITIDPIRRRLWAAGAEGGVKLEGEDYDARAKMMGVVARAASSELRRARVDPAGGPSDASYWDELYRLGQDSWELGRAAPPLARWFTLNPPRGKKVLVIGAGRGNEARFLAHLGAQVTAIDISEEAVTSMKALAAVENLTLEMRTQDLFTLGKGDYDYVVEHTCFCAVDPERRDEFVGVVADALKPGGELVGLFYDHGRPGGPPFTTDLDELQRRFAARFEWISDERPPDSVAARQGQEILVRLKKKA
jgi:SAM-dependent methyltransferase